MPRHLHKQQIKLIICLCLLFITVVVANALTIRKPFIPEGERKPLFDSTLSHFVRALVEGNNEHRKFVEQTSEILVQRSPVQVVLRKDGKRLASNWSSRGSWAKNIMRAVRLAKSNSKEKADTVELILTYGFETLKTAACKEKDQNSASVQEKCFELPNKMHRGILGLEISAAGKIARISPAQMIADNRDFHKSVNHFLASNHLSAEEITGLKSFHAYQLLIPLAEPDAVTQMLRGNTLVTESDVNFRSVALLANDLGNWLKRNVHSDGRMTYKYWPSVGTEAKSNNMIRQFMASVALNRFAEFKDSKDLRSLSKKNLNYNLSNFYKQEGSLAYIQYDRKIKLGAASLAALAIHEQKDVASFSKQHSSLQRFIEKMWNSDGSFKTFYKNRRNDNQNFYPGEALLYWAAQYEKTKDKMLLKKFMKSFSYYREWHLKNRNPAFIPWHTQAYYRVWQQTKNEELKDFIFKMNDWLISMQEWNDVQYLDTRGRFYNPAKPQYGVPHASSTGVYLEGLIDAYRLAKETGDETRVKVYRVIILRGLRSVMQLQYKDEVDMFYIAKRKQVKGGIRTTVDNNVIRVDNVQHNLMAVLKILQTFEKKDFNALTREVS